VPRSHEDKNAVEQIATEDVVLIVMKKFCVLHAEGEQLKDEVEKLNGGMIFFDGPVAGRVGQQRCHKHVHAVLIKEIEKVVLFRFSHGSVHVLGINQASYNDAELGGTS